MIQMLYTRKSLCFTVFDFTYYESSNFLYSIIGDAIMY